MSATFTASPMLSSICRRRNSTTRPAANMRHPFLARSSEVEDVVGIVRLNLAQRVKLYDGPCGALAGDHLASGRRAYPGHAVRARPYQPRLGRAGRPTSRIITRTC